MMREGTNEIDGVKVEVTRKRVRRINLRVGADGVVRVSLPRWRTTLREAETFLRAKWTWATKARERALAHAATRRAVTPEETAALGETLAELQTAWAAQLGVANATWRVRRVKSVWGCCHVRTRSITYNAELAHAPRALVEYVVVHELTHFDEQNHGPRFHALMDARLPDWQQRRKRLNARDFQ